jgi:hypothetical protein
MAEIKAISFDLDEEMLGTLRKEFDVDKAVTAFSESIQGKGNSEIKAAGKKVFTEYGENLAKRAIQLGEQHPDRTYEIIIKAVEDTKGYYKFALLPQRFLEVAYLGAFDMMKLHIVENNHNRLIYQLEPDECPVFDLLSKKCNKTVVDNLPCKDLCLSLLKTLHKVLSVDAIISMEAEIPKDGICKFMAKRA